MLTCLCLVVVLRVAVSHDMMVLYVWYDQMHRVLKLVEALPAEDELFSGEDIKPLDAEEDGDGFQVHIYRDITTFYMMYLIC